MHTLKLLHMLCAAISITGFVVRGVWMLLDSPLLARRWVRIVPHVNDALLLALGVWLSVNIAQYPFVHGWLTAKILAILAYIGLGMVALRRGRPKPVRAAAFFAALATFGYVVAVAVTRSALPGLG